VEESGVDQVQENQRNLRRLILSIRSSLGKLNLLIAICDNPQYQAEVTRSYEAELVAQGVDCVRVRIDRNLPSLKDALLGLPEVGDSSRVVTVFGASDLLGIRLSEAKSAQEKFFFSVQWTREGLRAFPYPVVLWVTEQVAVGLTREAPDFWSWRGGVFEFVRPRRDEMMLEARSSKTKRIDRSIEFTGDRDQNIANPEEIEQEIQVLLATEPDSPLLGSLYFSLGNTYRDRLNQGNAIDYQKELQLGITAFQQAIQRQEHSETVELADSLNNLAFLYKTMGDCKTAEPLYLRALEIKKQQLGLDHADTGTSLNNLADLYRLMERYEAAEHLYLSALAISEKQLGPDHLSTGTSLNNLASLYKTMGRYEDAESLFLRALAISKQHSGSDYPNAGVNLNNLAALYQVMGQPARALPLYEQAFAIAEKSLGPDHPNTKTFQNNLHQLRENLKKGPSDDAIAPLQPIQSSG
jgi:tetratricopeptide (TPR) repeat protein